MTEISVIVAGYIERLSLDARYSPGANSRFEFYDPKVEMSRLSFEARLLG
jgi:hypothetical protein